MKFKSFLVCLLIIGSLFSSLRAQERASLSTQALNAYTARQYFKSAQLFREAIPKGRLNFLMLYTAACTFALVGSNDEAFDTLEKAIAAGFEDVDHLKQNADLTSLHTDDRWPGVVKKCQAAFDKAKNINQELSAELLQMQKKEQGLQAELLQMQKEEQELGKEGLNRPRIEAVQLKISEVNTKNVARLKAIIEKYGWPGNSLVGGDGMMAAWLLIQHADEDLAFQKHCLELMTKAAEEREFPKLLVAYWLDRVLVAEGKMQVYGTQFTIENGEMVPFPIEDELNVDTRRQEIGLGPLEEHKKHVREVCQRNKKN